jgi:hypothetical protein
MLAACGQHRAHHGDATTLLMWFNGNFGVRGMLQLWSALMSALSVQEGNLARFYVGFWARRQTLTKGLNLDCLSQSIAGRIIFRQKICGEPLH